MFLLWQTKLYNDTKGRDLDHNAVDAILDLILLDFHGIYG